jgi:hypothetical protein
MQPWDVWRFVAGRTLEVRVGVLLAWERAAAGHQIRLEFAQGAIGSFNASELSVGAASLRDALDADPAGKLAVGVLGGHSRRPGDAIALGEWSWQGVEASSEGLSVEGVRVLQWDREVCVTANGTIRTPASLLAFSVAGRALVEPAIHLWYAELTALSQVAASGASVGTLVVERVAQ